MLLQLGMFRDNNLPATDQSSHNDLYLTYTLFLKINSLTLASAIFNYLRNSSVCWSKVHLHHQTSAPCVFCFSLMILQIVLLHINTYSSFPVQWKWIIYLQPGVWCKLQNFGVLIYLLPPFLYCYVNDFISNTDTSRDALLRLLSPSGLLSSSDASTSGGQKCLVSTSNFVIIERCIVLWGWE